MKLFFDMGDANFDGGVDILDLQSTILYAFNEYNSAPFNFTAADTYADEWINVQDVICTANILLSDISAANSAPFLRNVKNQSSDSDACVYIDDNALYLDSNIPVAAIDIAIVGAAEWCLDQYGFMTSSTDGHLIGYSLSGVTLPTGKIKLGEITTFGGIRKCVLSDESARFIGVNIKDNHSGVNSIEIDVDADCIIYDLNGMRRNSIGQGVNIVVDRNGVRKVIQRK
jgi:hypothetical protein